MSRIIGILGGMGPMSTADLFKKIIENTAANSDQDHFRIIIDNNAKIPSRILAITDGTASPLPEMKKSAKLLETAGADFIIIPCHTAHHWLKELRDAVSIPVLSLIEATTLYLSQHYGSIPQKILLLATEATIKLNLYQKSFGPNGITLVVPDPREQRIISAAIEEVKAGQIKSNSQLNQLNLIIRNYLSKGVSAVLGGCTEISLLFPYLEDNMHKIDPTLILAKTAIAYAQ